MEKLEAFQKLNNLFSDNNFSLFIVGGAVRDFLLNRPLDDIDLVTDATPNEMKKFIEGDFTFAHLGSIKVKFEGVKFDITTLRKEKRYSDFRHPADIKFVKSLKIDVKRRDFTINGLYLDKNYKIIDYINGQKDLENKIIKTIGCPYKRIKEDPLRILRAIRFSKVYGYEIDKKLQKAIVKYGSLLSKLSKDKIKQEVKKMGKVSKEELIKIFNKYSIQSYLDVVE